jgi:hypothetical protein
MKRWMTRLALPWEMRRLGREWIRPIYRCASVGAERLRQQGSE